MKQRLAAIAGTLRRFVRHCNCPYCCATLRRIDPDLEGYPQTRDMSRDTAIRLLREQIRENALLMTENRRLNSLLPNAEADFCERSAAE